jgi:pimeloyl-ACP methyl ester carboxylesterase
MAARHLIALTDNTNNMSRTRWEQIRRIWVTTGAAAGVFFIGWSLLAYRASAVAYAALGSGDGVTVTNENGYRRFAPTAGGGNAGLLFFAGALVDPVAYAPLARGVAHAGYTAVIVGLPWRGVLGGATSAELPVRYMRALRETAQGGGPSRWVVAGHSRGGVVACNVVRSLKAGIAGLVLVGTSHPRDFSLAHLTIPVTQIYGTRDTVADAWKVESARQRLPPTTRSVRIDGGNHAQFGHYGFQPGDWRATIPREEQQRITLAAILDALEAASRGDAR